MPPSVTVPAAQAATHRRPEVAILDWYVEAFDHNFVTDGPIPVAAHGTQHRTLASGWITVVVPPC